MANGNNNILFFNWQLGRDLVVAEMPMPLSEEEKLQQAVAEFPTPFALIPWGHHKYLTYEQCVKSNATNMMNVYKVSVAYVNGGVERVLTIKRSSKSDIAKLKVDGRAEAEKIILIMDNLNIHTIASLVSA